MASIAPFGTDLQPILRPKIMYSRVIHVPESLINVKDSSEVQEETILPRNYEEHNDQSMLNAGVLQAVQPQLNKVSKIHKSEEKDNREEGHTKTAESCTANICHSMQSLAIRPQLPKSLEYREPTSTYSIVDPDTTRLSQTCPPYFYKTQLPATIPAVLQKRPVTENMTDFRHQQSNHVKQISSLHLTNSRRYEGRISLISALRRCSNITGYIDKQYALKLLRLYDMIYSMNLPLVQLNSFVLGLTNSPPGEEGLFHVLIPTEALCDYISTVVT